MPNTSYAWNAVYIGSYQVNMGTSFNLGTSTVPYPYPAPNCSGGWQGSWICDFAIETSSTTSSKSYDGMTVNNYGYFTVGSVTGDKTYKVLFWDNSNQNPATSSGYLYYYYVTVKVPLTGVVGSATPLAYVSGANPKQYYVDKKNVSFTMIANYSNGSQVDVTNGTTWSVTCSSNPCTSVSFTGSAVNFSNISQNATYIVKGTYGGLTATWNIRARAKLPLTFSTVGSTSVSEQKTAAAQYSMKVNWDNGSNDTYSVNGWSLATTSYAAITSGGQLNTNSVTGGNKSITVKRPAHSLGTYFPYYPDYPVPSANLGVTITNNVILFTGITVSGASQIDELTSSNYTATAVYDESSSNADVTNSAGTTWSVNNANYATVNAGMLTAKEVSSPSTVTITASYNSKSGSKAVTINDLPPVLSKLEIALTSAPMTPVASASVNENTSNTFKALATYTNGTKANVNATWSVSSLYYASVVSTAGVLSTVAVTQEQLAILTATYTLNGVTQVATIPVTIKDVGKALVSLQIDGPATVVENSQASFTARALYDDGSSSVVSPAWAENSVFATVSASGIITAGAVVKDQGFVLSASYGADGVTRYAKRSLTLLDTDANAGQTSRVSVDSGAGQANAVSAAPAISSDGRYVAFDSLASNLATDTNGVADVFVRDRQLGSTQWVSVATGGGQADGASTRPSISANGQWVVFESLASTLAANDSNAVQDIFVRDRVAGTTERVSIATSGTQANAASYNAAISGDGRYVAFESDASNLVDGDTNNVSDIFIHDRSTHATNVVHLGTSMANGASRAPAISSDGALLAFSSKATNLVYGDSNGLADIFVYERSTGAISRVSIDSLGKALGGDAENPSVSGNGRYVAFELYYIDPVSGVRSGRSAVFIRDLLNGVTNQLIVTGNAYSGNMRAPHMSFDGRLVSFEHYVADIGNPSNGKWDVSLYDQDLGSVRLLAVNAVGVHANAESIQAVPSGDGLSFAFNSNATNLVDADTNLASDVFVRQIPAIEAVGKVYLQPMARAVKPTDSVVVDLFMNFGTNATLGGGLEVLYNTTMLEYVSFQPDLSLGDDAAFRAFSAPQVLIDGSLKNGKISFGHFDGLSGDRRIGSLTFRPASVSVAGTAQLLLKNNISPYGDFYGASTYVGQPVKFEGVTIRIGADTDGDGIEDSEDAFKDDPTEWEDTDGDGLGDNKENQLGTNPSSVDTDGDGLSDAVELTLGTNPLSQDTDGDGIYDFIEISLNQNPLSSDSDSDGVVDNIDAFPTLASESSDSDGDGVGDNSDQFPADPAEWRDFDGDGIGDNADADDDGDGMPDDWELAHELNPLNYMDAYLDQDGDGIPVAYEYAWGSDPTINNTGNGVSDIVKRWAYSLGGSGYESGRHSVVDGQGNLYVSGVFSDTVDFDSGAGVDVKSSFGSSDIFVSKYSSNGVRLWTKVIGGTGADSDLGLGVDAANNLYLYGQFAGVVDFDPNAGVQEFSTTATEKLFVAKLSADGDYVWAQRVEGTDANLWGRDTLAVDKAGNVYVAAINPAPFVTRINADGTSGWTHVLAVNNGSGEMQGVALDDVGNVYVSGTLGGSTDFLTAPGGTLGQWGYRNAFLMRLNPVDGSRVWVRTMDAASEGEAIEVGGGNVYIGGNFGGIVDFDSTAAVNAYNSGGQRGFVSKFDINGNYIWTRTLGNYVYGIGVDSQSDVYITGDFSNTSLFNSKDAADSYSAIGYGDNVFITKYLANGDYGWTEVLPAAGGANVHSLSVSDRDELYLTGGFYADVDLDPTDFSDTRTAIGSADIFILKLTSQNTTPLLGKVGGQAMIEGAILNLNLGATDVDAGNTLSFNVIGLPPFASFSDDGNGTASLSFAPGYADAGSYNITVAVADNGVPSKIARETFILAVSNKNLAPVANVGSNQTVNEGISVALSGSASDSDGTIASYDWSQVSGPAVIMSGATTASPRFTAPAVTSVTTLIFKLTVTDNEGAEGSAQVSITVNSVNTAPVANAGSNRSVNEGNLVILNGSGTDSDGTIASYVWNQVGGPSVGLSSTTSASVSFTAPAVSVATTLSFRLMVADNEGATGSAQIVVTVNPVTNHSPVANNLAIVTDVGVPISSMLSATDADGNALTFSIVADGILGNAVVTYPSSGAFTYTPNPGVTGTDIFTFVASDGVSNSNYATVIVNIGPVTNQTMSANIHYTYGRTWTIRGTTKFDDVYGSAVDSHGNVYSVGMIYGTVDVDPTSGVSDIVANYKSIYLTRINADGSYAWSHVIGGVTNNSGKAVVVDSHDNVYVAGEFSGTVDFDPGIGVDSRVSTNNNFFVAKFSADGGYLNTWTWGYQQNSAQLVYGIAVDAQDNLYVTGLFSGSLDFDLSDQVNLRTASGGYDVFVTKLTAAGVYGWTQTFDDNYVYGIAVSKDGNAYITGGNPDIYVAQIMSDGSKGWMRRIGGGGVDIGRAIALDGVGGVYVTGEFNSTVDFDPGVGTDLLVTTNTNSFLTKFGTDGTYKWTRRHNSFNSSGYAVAADAQGNVFFGGRYYSDGAYDFDWGEGVDTGTSNSTDFFFTRVNSAGDYIWTRAGGGANATTNEEMRSFVIDGFGNLYVMGVYANTFDFDPGVGIDKLVPRAYQDIFITKWIYHVDKDGDGVFDENDAFPNDSARW